jgi:hypothetical protein
MTSLRRAAGPAYRAARETNAMARDTLFSLLPAKLAEGLIAQASPVALAPDQVLFRTGDACDGC